MAVVTRYFSTTSAGAGDGTTWADRAALFTSGNWSSIITGFNFAGSDSLEARIGPGTYSCSQSLSSGLFANPPNSSDRPLYTVACDSSGTLWIPPNRGWSSAQPVWDTTDMPLINLASSVTCGLTNQIMYGIRFAGNTNGNMIGGSGGGRCYAVWCVGTNSGSSTGARVFSCGVFNCVGYSTGSTYGEVFGNPSNCTQFNSRAEGNPAATSGNRAGFTSGAFNQYQTYLCTSLNNPGYGYFLNGLTNGGANQICRCIAVGNAKGVLSNTTSTVLSTTIANSLIVNSSSWGIEVTGGQLVVIDTRLRNNASGDVTGLSNQALSGNITTAGTDADEFVDAASGDYRIKKTSTLWGKGIGAGDEPSSGSLILPSVSAWGF